MTLALTLQPGSGNLLRFLRISFKSLVHLGSDSTLPLHPCQMGLRLGLGLRLPIRDGLQSDFNLASACHAKFRDQIPVRAEIDLNFSILGVYFRPCRCL